MTAKSTSRPKSTAKTDAKAKKKATTEAVTKATKNASARKPAATELAPPKATRVPKRKTGDTPIVESDKPRGRAASKNAPSKPGTRAKSDKKKAPVVHIRELELEDLPAVYALGEELFTAERWPSLYRTWDKFELAEFFASADDSCFIAEDDDENLLGFILGTTIIKSGSAWSYGWVLWLGVNPEAARLGVASRLLERITERFAEDGVRILIADTDPRNEAALRFFEKNGFGHPRSHVYHSKNLSRQVATERTRPARKRRPRKKPR
ncbi:MAG: GNAT family N-acetyltransferase [Myxococcota bacterium]